MKKIPFCCPCLFKSNLNRISNGYMCSKKNCQHSDPLNAFPIINDIPILISETNTDTICSVEFSKTYVDRSYSSFVTLKKIIFGESNTTKENCNEFINLVSKFNTKAKVLVIGGGEKGSGMTALFESKKIEIISFDIYASNEIDFVCDAHYMAIRDESIDGIWIQAVLEHVVEPQKVVSEIFRVLKKNGIIYAETPFMQQVHEGAYDFTRFTVLGHRYLFRDFELIKMGGNKGPEVVLTWSLRYFIWALTRSRKLARLIGLVIGFTLRPFSLLMSKRSMFDSSSGVYFLGKKPKKKLILSHKELVSLYNGQF